MAVEDHPLYPKWSPAFDRMVETKRAYDEARMINRSASEVAAAKRTYEMALAEYNMISDKLD